MSNRFTVVACSCVLVLVLSLDSGIALAADCDGNGLQDECDLSCTATPQCNLPGCGLAADCDGDSLLDACEITAPAGCRFPTTLSSNTTAESASRFTGPPDDVYWGLGGQVVTYALPCFLYDDAGVDFTVYEVDSGGAEFNLVDVLVSADGVTFVSVKSSETAAVRVPGDEAHGNLGFARSYDVSAAGLPRVYAIRLDGSGTGAAGSATGFDLDAIGLIHTRADCNSNSIPDSCDISSGAPDCNANGLPDACEPLPDCNSNGIPDGCDVRDATSTDCNRNAIPDECDIDPVDPDGNGQVSGDCNSDGLPDECAACPPVEMVFVMDTSTSMEDEGSTICANISQIAAQLASEGIAVQAELLGISQAPGGIFACLTDHVINRYGTTVPGTAPPNNTVLGACPGGNEVASEDWGRATSVVAGARAWQPGALRIVIPIGDEGPWCGDPVSDPGVDRDSILHAVSVAVQNNVIVSPITGSGSSNAVISMAQLLAGGTGGTHYASSNTAGLVEGIKDIVRTACMRASDCNANGTPDDCDVDPSDPDGDLQVSADCDSDGTPDECEPDCNANAVADACDVNAGDPDGNGNVSADCNGNAVPDECEPDCNGNGIADACDTAGGVGDCNGDGKPDSCTITGLVRIGDADDFDNADGDGVTDLVTGMTTNYPGLGTGDGSGAGELFTDVNLTSGTANQSFVFSLPPGVYAAASLRILTFDVESTTGWSGTPILFDGVDSGFRLTPVTSTPSFNPGYVRLDQFTLSPTQLTALSDGALTVTLQDAPGVSTDDGAVFDYVELEYTLLDCNANGVPDECDVNALDPDGNGQVSRDCNTNAIPDECEADADADGVPDACDLCPGTIPAAPVDSSGCPPRIPGDFNRDGDVDNADKAVFESCDTGPALLYAAPPPGCGLLLESGLLPSDFDGDHDVDASDFGIFQRCYSGMNRLGNPLCGD